MKMKSLKAQFIGAIAMVLVAAIAMGSSTYAWFAMNTQVTATGMKVKAVAEGGIVIKNSGTPTRTRTPGPTAPTRRSTPPSSRLPAPRLSLLPHGCMQCPRMPTRRRAIRQ